MAGESDKAFTQADIDAAVAAAVPVAVEREVSGLRTKNTELLSNIRTLKDKILPFDGIDATAAREALELRAKSDEDRQKASGKFDELRTTLEAGHKKIIAERDDTIAKKTSKIHQLVGTNVALKSIEKLEGSSTLLMPHVERYLRVIEDEGDYVARIVDDKGKERMGPKGDPLTVDEYVTELSAKDEFLAAFKAPAAGGSGKKQDGSQFQRGEIVLTPEMAKDVQSYREAKARAEKEGRQLVIRG